MSLKSFIDSIRGMKVKATENEAWLVVGLGNPGPEYEATRHNVGFRAVDRLADELRIPMMKTTFSAIWGGKESGGREIYLAKPMTYMNLSGRAVSKLMANLKLPIRNVIVIHDDIDLEFSCVKVKVGGGSGGHRGLASITQDTGSPDYVRVRIGVGRPPGRKAAADFVLAPFMRSEVDDIALAIDRAAEAALDVVNNGVDQAMGRYNKSS